MGTRVALGVVRNQKTIVTEETQTPTFQPVVFDGILRS
jgi:hypothetical protein